MTTRCKKVRRELERQELAAFITDDPYHLFYLTGILPSTGRLLVTPSETVLFLDGRYAEEARAIASCEVVETKELDNAVVQRFPLKGTIGFSDTKTPYDRVKKWENSGSKLLATPDPISKVRQIKEPSEIALMRGAAEIALQGYRFLEKNLKPGVSEKELAALLEIFWLQNGGHHPSFAPIIAFGTSSAFPHYHPKHHLLRPEDGVQIDLGVEVEHYQSDLSRYYLPVAGHPLESIYSIVKEAQEMALQAIKPGVALRTLDEIARGVITKAGYGDNFPHSLGHGIGLEVHEGPTLRSSTPPEIVAEVGMCFTVEPGIYLKGIGGVRLEETIVVTKDGFEVLTR